MKKIEQFCKSKYLPFIVLTFFLLLIHWQLGKVADDVWFQEILNKQSLTEYLSSRYNSWTSRLLIESVLVILTSAKVSLAVWKILDIIMFEIMVYSIYKIFIKDDDVVLLWVLVMGALSIPTPLLNGAGWVATTINYLWPFAMGMYTFTLLKKKNDSKKIKWYETIIYILTALFAANQEQMAALLFGMISVYIVYAIIKKDVKQKVGISVILVYLISIAGLIFILTCPGNKVRNDFETKTWYPGYETFGLGSKIQLGITSMMKFLIIDGRIVYILFTGIIAYYMLCSKKSAGAKVLGVIPFITAVFLNAFKSTAVAVFPELVAQFDAYARSELVITAANKMTVEVYVPIIMYLIVLYTICVDLYLIFDDFEKKGFAMIIFLAGLASRIIIGFSSTVFASGERTSFFLYYAFVMLSVLILKEMKKQKMDISNISAIYSSISLLSVINIIEAFTVH